MEEFEANCEKDLEPNPGFLKDDLKWRWDFMRRKLPRLVTSIPESHSPIPVKSAGAKASAQATDSLLAGMAHLGLAQPAGAASS